MPIPIWLLLAFGALLPRSAAQASDTPHPLTISITAVVTDRGGRPVANLTREDFTLRDEGTPRPLDQVEFRRAGGRLFALFFDEYHVQAGVNTTRAREALAAFVDEQTRTDDRLVAMKPLDPITAISATADRGAIRQLVTGFTGCKGEYTPRTAFEAEYMSRAPEAAAVERSRVVLSDLTALASQLGSVHDMPKAIVFVTEGLEADVRAVINAANRAGVAVYVLDPADPADSPASLQALARETGGAITVGAADLPGALVQVAKDLDSYYVLRYRTPSPADGKFHNLEIATRRPGLQVRARRGYWSPLPARRASAASSTFSTDDLLSAHVSSLIRPWFRMTRGPQGHTRVTFSWQPSEVAGRAKTAAPERLQLTAATPDGTSLFDGPVAPLGAALSLAQSVPSRIVMDVAPGRLRTEMRISDGTARLLDRDIRFLDVPNLYAQGVIIMVPEILRARTARDFRELAAEADAPPSPARDFNRFERLLIRVRAYGPGEGPPQVSATLVNAVGQRLYPLSRVAESPDGLVQFDLPLSVLARGSYSIEIAAATGASRASRIVPIHIIG